MFGRRFWGGRYWGQYYWGQSTNTPPLPPFIIYTGRSVLIPNGTDPFGGGDTVLVK